MSELAQGYERIATQYLRARDRSIGVDVVRHWSTRLPRGARVLDVGCGPGVPITDALVGEGFAVHGVDASPTLAATCRQRLPAVFVECADVLTCQALDEAWEGIVSWGMVFLVPPDTQRLVLSRLAGALAPGGFLLFTAPRQVLTWHDALTDLPSWSLGEDAYVATLAAHGLVVEGTAEDEGGNFYYFARRPSA